MHPFISLAPFVSRQPFALAQAKCLDVQEISGEEDSTSEGHGRIAETGAVRCAHDDLTCFSRFQFDLGIQVCVAPCREVGGSPHFSLGALRRHGDLVDHKPRELQA